MESKLLLKYAQQFFREHGDKPARCTDLVSYIKEESKCDESIVDIWKDIKDAINNGEMSDFSVLTNSPGGMVK